MAQEDVPPSLVDPITYELFEDPVIASDNHTYERESILQWWAACASRGEPLLSPLTRERMTRELRPNIVVRQLVADLKARRAAQEAKAEETKGNEAAEEDDDTDFNLRLPQLPDEVTSVAALGRVFAAIDPLRDVLQELDWEPPQIVVMGNENSGKSTILERICMMPLFPTDKKICTRMVIKICLRRGEGKVPQLEVRHIDGRLDRGPIPIPMDVAAARIQEVMLEEVCKENGDRPVGVCQQKMLVVHVVSPAVPNLDLVDLPGLVAARVQGEPEQLVAQTRTLVESYLDKHAKHSMYLVTVPANMPANQSIAMDIIQQRRLEKWTIGVLTKSDLVDVAVDSDDEDDDVRAKFQPLISKLNQTAEDIIVLRPHGYVATMNKKPKKRFASGYEALVHQAQKEHRWFQQRGFDPSSAEDRTAANSLIARLMSMYQSYVMLTWLPGVLRTFEAERARLVQEDRGLGLPRAHVRREIDVRTLAAAATASFRGTVREQAEIIGNELDKLWSTVTRYQGERKATVDRWAWEEKLPVYRRQHSMDARKKVVESATTVSKLVIERIQNDQSEFKWGRFGKIVELLRAELAQQLQSWSDAAQTRVDAMLEQFYGMSWNPCIKVKKNSSSATKVDVHLDYRDVHDTMSQAVIGSLLKSLLEFDLGSRLPATAVDWIESCAAKRAMILERLATLQSAESHLLGVLGLSPDIREEIIQCSAQVITWDRALNETQATLHKLEAAVARQRRAAAEQQTQAREADSKLLEGILAQWLHGYGIYLEDASREQATISIDYNLHNQVQQFVAQQYGYAYSRRSIDLAAVARSVPEEMKRSLLTAALQQNGQRDYYSVYSIQVPRSRVQQATTARTAVEAAQQALAASAGKIPSLREAVQANRSKWQKGYQRLCELLGVPLMYVTAGAPARQNGATETKSCEEPKEDDNEEFDEDGDDGEYYEDEDEYYEDEDEDEYYEDEDEYNGDDYNDEVGQDY